jgi:hypothetical protein
MQGLTDTSELGHTVSNCYLALPRQRVVCMFETARTCYSTECTAFVVKPPSHMVHDMHIRHPHLSGTQGRVKRTLADRLSRNEL